MYPGLHSALRVEQGRYFRKVGVGVGANNAWQAGRSARSFSNDHGIGPRTLQLGEIALVGEKGDVARGRRFQRRDAAYLDRVIARDFAAEAFSYFSQAIR